MFNRNQRFAVVALFMTLTGALSACGGQAYRQGDLVDPGSVTFSDKAGNKGRGVLDGAPALDDEILDDSAIPSFSYSFEITGKNGNYPSRKVTGINTDNILKIKVIPGPAGNISVKQGYPENTYSNAQGSYNCVSYLITVGGRSQRTQNLALPGTNGQCYGATGVESQTLDFSDRLTPGHGEMEITITEARTDNKCMQALTNWMYMGQYSTYCLTSLYDLYINYTATGTLDIQTNGTAGL